MNATSTPTLSDAVNQVAKSQPGGHDTPARLRHRCPSAVVDRQSARTRSIAPPTEWLSTRVSALFASVGVALVALTGTSARPHHPLANRRFRRGYRAAHLLGSRTIVEAQLPPAALPVVRSRTPAAADGCPTTAPAGSTQERHEATKPLLSTRAYEVRWSPYGQTWHVFLLSKFAKPSGLLFVALFGYSILAGLVGRTPSDSVCPPYQRALALLSPDMPLLRMAG